MEKLGTGIMWLFFMKDKKNNAGRKRNYVVRMIMMQIWDTIMPNPDPVLLKICLYSWFDILDPQSCA